MEVGLREVLEQISARLNHVEAGLRDKADRWEMRIWFMTIMVLLGAILGVMITGL